MSGLTNIYVEKLGKKLFGNKFLGVYPADILPKKLNVVQLFLTPVIRILTASILLHFIGRNLNFFILTHLERN